MSDEAEPAKPRLDKAARRAERARLAKLSRLPFLYDYAQRGGRESAVAGFLQIAFIIAIVLVPAKLITGDWLPPGVALIALAVAYAVQAVNRFLNARAGRR